MVVCALKRGAAPGRSELKLAKQIHTLDKIQDPLHWEESVPDYVLIKATRTSSRQASMTISDKLGPDPEEQYITKILTD